MEPEHESWLARRPEEPLDPGQLIVDPTTTCGRRHASAWHPSADVRAAHTDPPPGLLSDAAFRNGFSALSRAGLSFDAWLYHSQLSELVGLARAHPDVAVVLDHLGGPLGIGPHAHRRSEVLEVWRVAPARVSVGAGGLRPARASGALAAARR